MLNKTQSDSVSDAASIREGEDDILLSPLPSKPSSSKNDGYSAESKKLIAFFGLVAVQVAIGVVYKISQNDKGTYAYSPTSALTMAELCKACLSCALFYHSMSLSDTPGYAALPSTNSHANKRYPSFAEAFRHFKNESSKRLVQSCFGLAILYAFNNNLTFWIMKKADPSTLNVVKSGSTFVTAILLYILLRRTIKQLQWVAIFIQLCGLLSSQINACSGGTNYPASAYGAMIVSLTISCLTGTANDHITKKYSRSLHVQNIILYLFGIFFNFFAYCVGRWYGREPGFFDNYSTSVLFVVFCNSIIGIVITAVYKYADAVIKNIATSVTTGILYAISITMFGAPATAHVTLGFAIVFCATFVYMKGG